ncbi:MAG: subtilisin-like proprotein convertase family protein [Myxococcota bacterium]
MEVVVRFLLALFVPTLAHAVPVQLTQQGRLMDAGTGLPLDGDHSLDVRFYADPVDGAPVWEEVLDVEMIDGFYSLRLGDDPSNPLDDELFAGDPLYLAVAIDGGLELPMRFPVDSVPFARRAQVATDVQGGVVDASEVRINGELVIDADGVEGDGDTLAGLVCGPGDVAVWDGGRWLCTPLPDDVLGGLSCADGEIAVWDGLVGRWLCADDAVLSPAEVAAIVQSAPVDLAPGSSVDGAEILTAGPGLDVPWSAVGAKPVGFADDIDDDLLADISCRDGEILGFDAVIRTWVCTSDQVLDGADVDAFVMDGPLDLHPSTTIGGVPIGGGRVDWSALDGIPADFADGEDADTLVMLGCSVGQVAAFDGARWACAPDAVLDAEAVITIVSGAPLELAFGTTIGGAVPITGRVDWDDLVGRPLDLLDGDSDALAELGCADGQIPVRAGASWTCGVDATLTSLAVIGFVEDSPVNLAGGSQVGGQDIVGVDSLIWSNVGGKPAGFADGIDNDSFASAVCADGQVLVWNGGGFECQLLAPGADGDTLADLSLFCEDGEVAVWDAGGVQWVCAPDQVLGADEVIAIVNGTDLDLGPGTTLGGVSIVDAVLEAGGLEEGVLPFNGLDEVSNGLLTNQFVESFSEGGIPLPDNSPPGIDVVLDVPDIGIAEWLTVTVVVDNSDVTGVHFQLIAPDGAFYDLYDGERAGEVLALVFPEVDPTLSGDLTEWVGRNPVGTWTLHIVDDLFLDNTFDGELVEWTIEFQHVSNQRVALNGDLQITDSLEVDTLHVLGDLRVDGSTSLATLLVDNGAQVEGGLQIGGDADACDEASEGTLRYSDGAIQVCLSDVWETLELTRPDCPDDMVWTGVFCIDREDNGPVSWQAQVDVCHEEGKRMCSMAEWIAACNDDSLSLDEMLDGNFEYVDEYWVMNYTNGNYYSSYVSVGNDSCGRIYYSGWGCANSSCTDTTNPGDDYESRCCL